MKQRGRQSGVALAVVGPVDDDGATSTLPAYLRPPPTLTDAEREVWTATVDSKPASWFGIEHGPMLVEYVRNVCRASVIAEQMEGMRPEDLETDEGLRRYDRLQGMAIKTAGIIHVLMRAMRMTHSSIYRASKAGMGPGKGRKPWQRED